MVDNSEHKTKTGRKGMHSTAHELITLVETHPTDMTHPNARSNLTELRND